MTSSVSLPPDTSARLAQLAEMQQRTEADESEGSPFARRDATTSNAGASAE